MNEMSRLCTICARGGSKGVKNKNLRSLLGKPLIAHTIEQALESNLFQYVSVSSDSDEILEEAANYGAHVLIKRPPEMATDTAAKLPAIQHCVRETEKRMEKRFHTIVDMDATSPLRLPADIVNAVSLLESSEASNVITGMPSRRSPYFNLVELNDKGYVELSKTLTVPIVRRQDAPKCYDMNASIYVWRREILLGHDRIFFPNTKLYEMPEERSIDIDSELDWKFVEWIMENRTELKGHG